MRRLGSVKARGLSLIAAIAATMLLAAVGITQEGAYVPNDPETEGQSFLSQLGSALGRSVPLSPATGELEEADESIEPAAEQDPAQLAGGEVDPANPPSTGGEPQPTPAGTGGAELPPNADSVNMVSPNTFDIHVKGADLRTVLKLLSTQGRKNIVATRDVSGEVTADLYHVGFHEALDAVLKATGYVAHEDGDFVYIYTPEQLETVLASEMEMLVRVFRLSYVKPEDIKSLIEPVLSTEGTVSLSPETATGISTSDSDAGGYAYATSDVMIIRDYEENVAEIARIIEQVDVLPEQVLIEATLLRASLTSDNDLGVNLTTMTGLDFNSIGASSDTNGVTFPTAISGNQFDEGFSKFHTSLATGVGKGGLAFAFVQNDIALFIRALESVTDVTVMANPKLMVVNKQRGEVMIGERNGYLTTTVTDTVATETVEFLETGTRLVVRPYIGRNGYVRMEVHPEDSSGSVVQVGTSALPSERTVEVTTNLIVKDGRTVVIGGLFSESTTKGRSQLPIVGDIPIAGTLFRSTDDTTAREEVMVLITPNIVRQENAEAVGEQMKYEAERQRIGARKGLEWWNRERLAATYLRWARQELRKGNRGAALWNVDLALSIMPRMTEAISLKERITNKAYWADEARGSNAKYMIERMIMQDLGKPVEEVIPPQRPLDVREIDPEVRDAFGIEELIQKPLPQARKRNWLGIDVTEARKPETVTPAYEPAPPAGEVPTPAPLAEVPAAPDSPKAVSCPMDPLAPCSPIDVLPDGQLSNWIEAPEAEVATESPDGEAGDLNGEAEDQAPAEPIADASADETPDASPEASPEADEVETAQGETDKEWLDLDPPAADSDEEGTAQAGEPARSADEAPSDEAGEESSDSQASSTSPEVSWLDVPEPDVSSDDAADAPADDAESSPSEPAADNTSDEQGEGVEPAAEQDASAPADTE